MSAEKHHSTVLDVADVHKRFGGNRVLQGLTFSLPRSNVTALIGSNGAGKSTFLNVLSGILPADEGSICVNGVDMGDKRDHERARVGLARTFQHPRTFRSFSVLDAVVFAQTASADEGLLRGLQGTFAPRPKSSAGARDRAIDCLEKCRLIEKAQAPGWQLTYGEQKLLMLAQAMASGGNLLCLDELCAGLQPALVDGIAELILQLAGSGATVLVVEHNLELVRKIAQHSVFLHEGRVFREGRTEDVLADPDVIRLYLGE